MMADATGAKMAISTMRTMTTTEAIATQSCRSRSKARAHGPRPSMALAGAGAACGGPYGPPVTMVVLMAAPSGLAA